MKSTIKSFGVLFTAAVICTTLAKADDKAAPASSDAAAKSAAKVEDLFPDVVVIKGKGFEVKRSRFDEDMINVKADALSKGQEIPQAQMAVLQRRVLDRLILDQILLTKATAADKAKGKEDGDKQFELIKKAEPSEEVLSRKLRAVGLSVDKFHSRLIEEFTIQPMLRAKASITETQIKKFYDENPSKFEDPEMVRVSYILKLTSDPKTGSPLSDEAKKAKKMQLEDLLKRARAGEDFTKLAKEFSEDPSAKENGGEIKLPHNNPKIPPEFEAAAFSLKTNQVSDVVTTMYGYCIIKLAENIPARKITLTETSKRIEDYLAQMEVEKMLPKYYTDLKKEAGVEILDKDLKAIEEIPAADAPDRNAAASKVSSPGNPVK
jgi:PPIC-type PPIASE domain